MNDRLRTRGEVLRLARVLGTDPGEVAFLDGLDAEVVRTLNDQVTSALFDTSTDRLRGIEAAANLLPPALAASIGERAMGPVLCALLVGAVDDARLVQIARRLSVPFLAEVAVHIDPRRVGDVVAALPAETIAGVARELVEREEHAAMGDFFAYLGDDALAAAVEQLDGASLLHVGAMSPDRRRVGDIVAGLDDDRLREVLEAAARTGDWLEALALFDALARDQRTRVADLLLTGDEEAMTELATFATDEALWATLLPVLAAAGEDRRPRLAELDVLGRADTVAAIVEATVDEGLWSDLLPLARHLPTEAHEHLAGHVRGLDADDLYPAIVAANEAGLHDDLIAMLRLLSDDDQDGLLGAALARTAAHRTWTDLLPLLALLPDATQERLAAQAEALSDRDLAAFVRAVDRTDLWDPALHLVARWAGSTQDRLLGPMGRLSKRTRRALGDQAEALDLRERLGRLGDLLDPPER